MDADLESLEAINRAMVVIDCTPKGVGIENKNELKKKWLQIRLLYTFPLS